MRMEVPVSWFMVIWYGSVKTVEQAAYISVRNKVYWPISPLKMTNSVFQSHMQH